MTPKTPTPTMPMAEPPQPAPAVDKLRLAQPRPVPPLRKRPGLLALTALLLAGWTLFLAYLAWRS